MRHLFFEKLKFSGSILSLAFIAFSLTSFVFIDNTSAVYREYNEVHCMNNRGNYRPFACNAEEYGFGWSGTYGFDDGFTWEGSGCTMPDNANINTFGTRWLHQRGPLGQWNWFNMSLRTTYYNPILPVDAMGSAMLCRGSYVPGQLYSSHNYPVDAYGVPYSRFPCDNAGCLNATYAHYDYYMNEWRPSWMRNTPGLGDRIATSAYHHPTLREHFSPVSVIANNWEIDLGAMPGYWNTPGNSYYKKLFGMHGVFWSNRGGHWIRGWPGIHVIYVNVFREAPKWDSSYSSQAIQMRLRDGGDTSDGNIIPNNTVVRPGQEIKWSPSVKFWGTEAVHSDVGVRRIHAGDGFAGWNNDEWWLSKNLINPIQNNSFTAKVHWLADYRDAGGTGNQKGWNNTWSIKINNNQGGYTFCRGWDQYWINGWTAGWMRRADPENYCVKVAYNFQKYVCSSDEIPDVIVAGTTYEYTGMICNRPKDKDKPPTNSSPNWKIRKTQIKFNKGVTTIPDIVHDYAARINHEEPCTDVSNGYLKPPANDCRTLAAKDGQGRLPSQATGADANTIKSTLYTNDLDVGEILCVFYSFNKPDTDTADDANAWYHSTPECAKIAKKPSMQVWGSDTVSRDVIKTSITEKNIVNAGAVNFGSWGEYGVIAQKSNNYFASGSAFANPNGYPSPIALNQSSSLEWNRLTMASQITAADVGSEPNGSRYLNSEYGFFNLSSMNSTRELLKTRLNAAGGNIYNIANIDVDNLSAGTYRYSNTTPVVNIRGGEIAKGKTIWIYAPHSTVNILSDGAKKGIYSYPGPYSQVSEIPQIVIVARDINIDQDVENVDAWLVASKDASGSTVNGSVNTCSGYGHMNGLTLNPLTSEVCNKQLRINGIVVADHLLLSRTHGAGKGADSGNPGEIINLRPDSYLWAQHQSMTNSSQASTIYQLELPPRL